MPKRPRVEVLLYVAMRAGGIATDALDGTLLPPGQPGLLAAGTWRVLDDPALAALATVAIARAKSLHLRAAVERMNVCRQAIRPLLAKR